VLTAFVPIWALTVLGYLVGRSGVLGDRAEPVLGRLRCAASRCRRSCSPP